MRNHLTKTASASGLLLETVGDLGGLAGAAFGLWLNPLLGLQDEFFAMAVPAASAAIAAKVLIVLAGTLNKAPRT